jgi:hypothetical protein
LLCVCPARYSQVGLAGTLFTDLDPIKKYWPQVQRDIDNSFFGIDPLAIQPKEAVFVEDEGGTVIENS